MRRYFSEELLDGKPFECCSWFHDLSLRGFSTNTLALVNLCVLEMRPWLKVFNWCFLTDVVLAQLSFAGAVSAVTVRVCQPRAGLGRCGIVNSIRRHITVTLTAHLPDIQGVLQCDAS